MEIEILQRDDGLFVGIDMEQFKEVTDPYPTREEVQADIDNGLIDELRVF